MKLENYLKFLEYFSLITVTKDKIPNYKWKEQQETKLTPEEFSRHFKSPTTDNVGIVTGFEDLEVVDVDLKVFSTTTEKETFWKEFISLLKDAIFDFDKKFVIYKTMNAGYHILYKTKRVKGNQKLAKLKNHRECIIETRGTSGYVFMYPKNKVSELSYFNIQYITDDDWESLMRICKSFNYVVPEKDDIQIDKKTKDKFKTSNQNGLPPWDDFNSQNTVWDVVRDEFTIYRDTPKKTFIKRTGAKSSHSGYIYKEDNLMYLFSTGTIYPNEKQISPYYAYVIKYHNGDFSAAASDLYQQGYGDRLKVEIKEKEKTVPDKSVIIRDYLYNENHLSFPIDVFPKTFQNYIMECNEKLDSIVDYMGCGLLWVISLICGNRFKVKVKNGWYENPVVWFSLVGRAGVGKTPSIQRMLYPLIKENNNLIKDYIKKKDEFDEYDKLSKKEKEQTISVENPTKKQFIADDITLEALVDLHECVPTGVGVFKDELAGWLKDMNKYREGSDLEFWLSTWSGSSVNVNRLTRRGSFVENPFIPVIGGIQPGILNELYTQEKKDNGFMDRMLISYPEITIPKYNEQEISIEAIQWYNSRIISLRNTVNKSIKMLTENNHFDNPSSENEKIECIFSDEAKKLWIKKFNEITNKQNSDDENEYFKSMYPKQKSYIPRFAFLINILNSSEDDKFKIQIIDEKSMEGAIKLSDYFVATAKKIKFENKESEDIKKSLNKNSVSVYEKVKDAYKINPDFNRSQLAGILNVSRRTIQNYISQIKSEKQ